MYQQFAWMGAASACVSALLSLRADLCDGQKHVSLRPSSYELLRGTSKGFNCKEAHWSCLISVLLCQSYTWSEGFFNEFPMSSRMLLPLKTTWRPMTRVMFPVHQALLQNAVATVPWNAIVLDLIVKAQLDSISYFRWGLRIKPCPSHIKYCLLMVLDETEDWRL